MLKERWTLIDILQYNKQAKEIENQEKHKRKRVIHFTLDEKAPM